MNNLLIFFAFPVSTIILSVVLQKILNCPLTVAATFFAVYLIVTFTTFDTNFLVETIAYTIIAYLTALTVKFICNKSNQSEENSNACGCNNISNNTISEIDNSCICRKRF